VRDLVRDYQ
jgi:hypothetical protein